MQTQTETAASHSDFAMPSEAPPTLYQLAVGALADNANNADIAEEFVFSLLLNDQALLRSLVRSAVKSAVTTNVGKAIRNQREVIFDKARAAAHGKRIALAHIESVKSSFLDFPLADGTRLRDATRVEVLEAVARYEKQSETMAHRARWLRALADIVPAGRRIGDFIDEGKAKELFEKAA